MQYRKVGGVKGSATIICLRNYENFYMKNDFRIVFWERIIFPSNIFDQNILMKFFGGKLPSTPPPSYIAATLVTIVQNSHVAQSLLRIHIHLLPSDRERHLR